MRGLIYKCFLVPLLLHAQTMAAQVYEQSYLMNRMPQIPEKIVGVTEEEKEAYQARIDSLENYFDDLAKAYRHPVTSLEKSSQQDMFEFEEIWRDLYQLQNTMAEYSTKVSEEMSLLSQEEFVRKDKLSAELRRIRNEGVKGKPKEPTPSYWPPSRP